MINVNYKYEEVFNNIKTYINKYYQDVKVIKHRAIKLQYPCVVVEQNSNILGSMSKDSYGKEHTRELSFEITIYAVDNQAKQITGYQTCEQLEQMVINVMQRHYRMQGGTDARLPFINQDNATQFTLHFSCEWLMDKNIIY